LHIVHIIHSLNIGGAQKYMAALIPPIENQKNYYSVIYSESTAENIREELSVKNVQIYKYPGSLPAFRPYRIYKYLKSFWKNYKSIRLLSLVRHINPDLIHIHHQKLAEVVDVLHICNALKIPLVWTIHGHVFSSQRALDAFAHEMIVASEKRLPVAITFVGRFPEYLNEVVKQSNVKIVHTPPGVCVTDFEIDDRYRECCRGEAEIPSDTFVIGNIGRLSREKGIDVLLNASQNFVRPGLKYKLIIVGDGPERQYLEDLTSQLHINENVVFVGVTDNVKKFLALFDLYVQPSRSEGLPIAILEAMSAGIPTIATDVGGVSYAVKNLDTGILIPPEDDHALAAAILALMDDPETCRIMSVKAKIKISDFDIDRFREKFAMIYSDLFVTMANENPGSN